MKYFLASLAVFAGLSLSAQAPQAFNYQAVIRNSGGNLLVNQAVGIQLSVIKSNVNGTVVYVERHNVSTNAFALVELSIGTGTPQSGTFSAIDWANDNSFIKIEIDPAGGTSYTDMGTTQLLSVPYALVAGKAMSSVQNKYTQSGPLNISSFVVDSVGFKKMSDFMTFTKQSDSSQVEVLFQSRISGGTFNGNSGTIFELRVNDQAPDFGGIFAITTTNTVSYINNTAVFNQLPAGTYAVSIWARVSPIGTSTLGLTVDPGGWGGRILVKELF